jgi:acyl carrier protein
VTGTTGTTGTARTDAVRTEAAPTQTHQPRRTKTTQYQTEAPTDEGNEHVTEQTPKATDETNEILDGLAEILEEIAGVKPKDVELDKSFIDDLDVDSLSMVEIALAAEDKFDVKIPDDQLAGLKTVGDAVSYIQKAKVA